MVLELSVDNILFGVDWTGVDEVSGERRKRLTRWSEDLEVVYG